MKPIKIILGILLSLFILGISYFTYNLFINTISPREYVQYKNEGKEINISYYRPFKKDRLIFGDSAEGAFVPYGVYWRLGANLTTKLTTNQDLDFAGLTLPKGSYGLYVYPYAENWLVFVHTKTGGISFNEPEAEGIIMKVNVPVTSLSESLEQFTIDFVDSSLRFRWDTTEVLIPIH